MTNGLRALLDGVIDYAGMFPPAKLSLDEALGRYLKYRNGPDAWMLQHFVVPVTDLGNIPDSLNDPITVSVIGRGGADGSAWVKALVEDVQAAGRFEARFAGHATAPSLEVRLPDGRDEHLPVDARQRLTEAGLAPDTIYLEVPDQADADALRQDLAPLLPQSDFGLKLRTGGLEASAVPSIPQMAEVIDACARSACRWKATAGLHHPVRSHRDEVGGMMHGFLNVLVAAVLAEVHQLPRSALEDILAEESAGAFSFDDEGLRWGNYPATVEEVGTVRRERLISFGSCSFDEPREDLRELGLW